MARCLTVRPRSPTARSLTKLPPRMAHRMPDRGSLESVAKRTSAKAEVLFSVSEEWPAAKPERVSADGGKLALFCGAAIAR